MPPAQPRAAAQTSASDQQSDFWSPPSLVICYSYVVRCGPPLSLPCLTCTNCVPSHILPNEIAHEIRHKAVGISKSQVMEPDFDELFSCSDDLTCLELCNFEVKQSISMMFSDEILHLLTSNVSAGPRTEYSQLWSHCWGR